MAIRLRGPLPPANGASPPKQGRPPLRRAGRAWLRAVRNGGASDPPSAEIGPPLSATGPKGNPFGALTPKATAWQFRLATPHVPPPDVPSPGKMPHQPSTRRTTYQSLSIGGPMAEKDPLLASAFLDNGTYSAIISPDDHHWFLIGRTGSGKSAALYQLEADKPGKVARINPAELAFRHITNQDAVRTLLSLDVRLEPFFHALWRTLILCQVVRHRYQSPTDDVKRGLFERLRGALRRNPSTAARLAYVDQLEASFWKTTEDQIREQVDTLVKTVKAEAGLNFPALPVSLSGEAEETTISETRAQLRERFQKVVNDQVVFQLASIASNLAEEALESDQNFTYLVIDDLDLTWVEDSLANVLIKCLLQVTLEMQRARHLKILIALRTNIFDQLAVGRQARGGQEEKLRATAMYLGWTRNNLKEMVNLRLAAESKELRIVPVLQLRTILPPSQKGISPFNYILNRTLMRPRDVILYLNHCLAQCTPQKPRISWALIRDVEHAYSVDRLSALRDEWNDPYYDIARVFNLFRGRPWAFGVATLEDICDDVALLLKESEFGGAQPAFAGSAWLTPLCEPRWAPGAYRLTWKERSEPQCELLFHIGFLGFIRRPGQDAEYGQDPAAAFDVVYDSLDDQALFSVHPAFRAALGMVAPGGSSDSPSLPRGEL